MNTVLLTHPFVPEWGRAMADFVEFSEESRFPEGSPFANELELRCRGEDECEEEQDDTDEREDANTHGSDDPPPPKKPNQQQGGSGGAG